MLPWSTYAIIRYVVVESDQFHTCQASRDFVICPGIKGFCWIQYETDVHVSHHIGTTISQWINARSACMQLILLTGFHTEGALGYPAPRKMESMM